MDEDDEPGVDDDDDGLDDALEEDEVCILCGELVERCECAS